MVRGGTVLAATLCCLRAASLSLADPVNGATGLSSRGHRDPPTSASRQWLILVGLWSSSTGSWFLRRKRDLKQWNDGSGGLGLPSASGISFAVEKEWVWHSTVDT